MAHPYKLMNAKLKPSILNHINAVIIIPWLEQPLSLLQLHKHHVPTQLQKQGLLKMTKHPEMDQHSTLDKHQTFH